MSGALSPLSPDEISRAVEAAGLAPLADGVAERFSQYYDLLARWNSRLNLTAIRTPGEVLQRHFVECIFCAQHLPSGIATLLDYGSGAGFPGIPIALCRPEIQVALAESQGKKASFLREVVRSLGLSAEVFADRVEAMGGERQFGAVTLRAVDNMEAALNAAAFRVEPGGYLVALTSKGEIEVPDRFTHRELPLPNSQNTVLMLAQKQ